MQIFRYAEQGSIELLWISATNPAVSMPDLHRVRQVLTSEKCFVVVQDAFLTETARLADVVLPAAGWGEKTGTYTNVNRTVHLSEKAVEPPGEARSDLDIFLAYADAMDFRDKDGGPLITWRTPEQAFEAWKRCSAGRPCDYTALTYDRLSGPTGICWPVTDEHPDGTERLYGDGVFPTSTDYCETYGRDLLTGGAVTREQHAAQDPAGRAVLRGAPYVPPLEEPDDDYPLRLATGRTVYHFHTRTKTGAGARARGRCARRLGRARGGRRRGARRRRRRPGAGGVPTRLDRGAGSDRAHASSRGHRLRPLPLRVLGRRCGRAGRRPRAARGQRADADVVGSGVEAADVQDGGGPGPARGGDVMARHLSTYVGLVHRGEQTLVDSLRQVASGHPEDPDTALVCRSLARQHEGGLQRLGPSPIGTARRTSRSPSACTPRALTKTRSGGVGLLRDLQDLHVLAALLQTSWTILEQAAQGARDDDLLTLSTDGPDPGREDDRLADHASEGGVAADPARRPVSLPSR
jgi:hypothetical protein